MNNLRDIFGSQDERSNTWGSGYLKLDSGKDPHTVNVGTQFPNPESTPGSEDGDHTEDEEWEKKNLRYGWGKFKPE
jgi:hypothetical protein